MKKIGSILRNKWNEVCLSLEPQNARLFEERLTELLSSKEVNK